MVVKGFGLILFDLLKHLEFSWNCGIFIGGAAAITFATTSQNLVHQHNWRTNMSPFKGCNTPTISIIWWTNAVNFGWECLACTNASSLADIATLPLILADILFWLLLLSLCTPSPQAASIHSINCHNPPSCNSLRSKVDWLMIPLILGVRLHPNWSLRPSSISSPLLQLNIYIYKCVYIRLVEETNPDCWDYIFIQGESECWPPFLVLHIHSADTISKAAFTSIYPNNPLVGFTWYDIGIVEQLYLSSRDCKLIEGRSECRQPNLQTTLLFLDMNTG